MTDPAPFEDVNEAAGVEWEAETTPYQRVREVIAHTYDPVSADELAAEARTSPKTARKHLDALAEEGFVATGTGENGATLYHRSPESLVMEEAASINARVSTDELLDRIEEMREQIRGFRAEYGAESPEELAVDRANRDLAGGSGEGREGDPDTERVDPDAIREWKTTRRNLAFATAALSIANAREYVADRPDANPSTS